MKKILLLAVFISACLFPYLRNAQPTINDQLPHTRIETGVRNLPVSQDDPPAIEGQIEMILVNGGTFVMGDNVHGPKHSVTLDSFMIGKYEVTFDLWQKVMGTKPPKEKNKLTPVEGVSWDDVIKFCNKLSEKEGLKKAYSGKGANVKCDFTANGYRLPTEAEWEFAARGGNLGKGYTFSGGNDINKVAWYMGNLKDGAQVVGKKQPNELGIFDMSGNLWEMCWDWHADYSSSSQINPRGPKSGECRVIRGGSFFDYESSCSVSTRSADCPNRMFAIAIGFRLVRSK